jgi:RNA polymerase sigma-70 factor, ECF subfamily
LRLEELALARACAKGTERAWEIFLNRYREKLYGAALAITKEEAAGRELADSVYAELFGTSKGGGPRVSKLTFYAGRGSLEGWLRTVLAQEFVNRYRSERRLVSLEEQTEAGAHFAAAPAWQPEPGIDPRLEAATDEALRALGAEDRYILAAHYLDGCNLAEIGRLLRIHESTVSRRIEKIVKALRKRILAGLRERGMSRDQAQEALQADVREISLDVAARLRQDQAQEKGSGIVP